MIDAKTIDSNYTKKALRAATFVIFGYGLSQVLRLSGNLVLTRLLTPEFFGLIALARVFMRGINLFSDIGLEPGIIRSPRAEDTTFLNTAWTLQIIRGIILFICSVIIAYPVAQIYHKPILIFIIPVIGLGSIIQGLQSTSIITLSRELRQGKLAYIELLTQVINIICMIILAYLYRNIWSLVIGGLLSITFKTIWSHSLDHQSKNVLRLERPAVKELLSFGKWIFISTAIMFLATQADRLLLGKIFPLTLFGVYNIAVIFAEIPKKIITTVSQKVIFPLISKFAHIPRIDLRTKIGKQRKLMLIPLAFLTSILVSFGDILILQLYDQRYDQAAWILPLLALGMWPLILYSTIDRSLYAIGKPKYAALGNLVKFVYMIVSVPLLYYIGGRFGAILAVAMNDIPIFIVVNIGLAKEKLSLMKQDLFSTLLLISMIILFVVIRSFFGLGFPGEAVFYGN